MNIVSRRGLPRGSMLAILALACACTDGPVAPNFAPEPGLLSTEYECRIDLKANTMECGLPSWEGVGGGPRPDLLLYGTGAKAVIVSGPTYSRADNTNSDTVTYSIALTNLMPQPIGTTDGITADPSGNRLVITKYGETPANATLDNADGTATFIDSASAGGPYTFPSKQYISYPGVLGPNDTSQVKTARFVYSPTVTSITIKYRISSPVQYPYGWITISPATVPILAPAEITSLMGIVYDAFGVPLSDAITWSSSNTGVATVNASTGQVTAVGNGTAVITATSTVNAQRTGTRTIAVDEAPEVMSTTPADNASPVAADGNIMIFFSEAVNVSTSSFLLECPIGEDSQTFTVSGSGTSTVTLDPDLDLPEQAICTVTVEASVVSDADLRDGPDVMDANHVFSFEVGITIDP